MKRGGFLMWTIAAAALTAGAWAGDISGTVVFEGKAPRMRPIGDMEGNPDCAILHGDAYPMRDWLVLGEGQSVAHIIVRVVSGLPAGVSYPLPDEAAVLSQKGCVYTPHAFVVRKGQPLKVVNPDRILHNIHALPESNTEFNKSTSKQRPDVTVVFDKVEGPFAFKCDTHPWMQAFCAVADHPFYAVTGKDGRYTIEGLPEGEYEIEFWHERLGVKIVKVAVPAEGSATLDVTYTRP